MKRFFFYCGRLLQLLALCILPAAIWASEIDHSEQAALTLFLGCLFLFIVGFIIVRLVS